MQKKIVVNDEINKLLNETFSKNDYKLSGVGAELIIDRDTKKKFKDYTDKEKEEMAKTWSESLENMLLENSDNLKTLSKKDFEREMEHYREDANRKIKK